MHGGRLIIGVVVLAVFAVLVYFNSQALQNMMNTPPQTPTPEEAATVATVAWHVERANPDVTEDDYRFYEHAISIDVTFADGTTERYPLGNAYGCNDASAMPYQDGTRQIYGELNCYFAASGTDFTAFTENGTFMVERFKDDASGETAGETTVVLEL